MVAALMLYECPAGLNGWNSSTELIGRCIIGAIHNRGLRTPWTLLLGFAIVGWIFHNCLPINNGFIEYLSSVACFDCYLAVRTDFKSQPIIHSFNRLGFRANTKRIKKRWISFASELSGNFLGIFWEFSGLFLLAFSGPRFPIRAS